MIARERAVQHAAAPADGQRRAVAAGLDPLARGLDADQRHAGVVEERPRRCRSRSSRRRRRRRRGRAAARRARASGRAPRRRSTRWRSRTSAGYGRGPDAPSRSCSGCRRRWRPSRGSRADVASLSVRAPASTGSTRRAEQPHALHVGLLAAHVLGAHVDDALEAEQRAGGRGRDAVLARAGLGDDPRLAHALGEQRLAERVVDLVRARVDEVLALEPDRVAGRLGEPLREVQRRRAARVVAQQRRELGAEAGVVARRRPTPPRARRARASASRARTGRRRGRSGARRGAHARAPAASSACAAGRPRRGTRAPSPGP